MMNSSDAGYADVGGRGPRARPATLRWSSARSILPRRWNTITRALLFNAGSLVGATAVTSALGLVYWWVAARRFAPSAVGFASAAFSAMTLVGTVGVLGLATLLTSELPRRPHQKESMIATALVVSAVVAGALGITFAILAPFLSSGLRSLGQSGPSVALFALGCSLTAVILVLDQLLITLLKGGLRFWRNVIFSVAKLGALFVAAAWWAQAFGMAIFASWVAGYIVCLAALFGYFIWNGGFTRSYRPQWSLLRGLGLTALAHHALNVALQVTTLTMPLLVTALLSSTANAYFYTAQMITALIAVGPLSLTAMLFVVGTAQPAALAARSRLTLSLGLALCAVANAAIWVSGGFLLGLFGHVYAENALWPLRLSCLAVFPMVIREHYVVIWRIHDRMMAIIPLVLTVSACRLVLAGLGAHVGGLLGLCWGALAASCVEALVMAPAVWRMVTSGKPTSVVG